MSTRYKIVRFLFEGPNRVIKTGLTREEAMEHCDDPETSSRTCSPEIAIAEKIESGSSLWFDGFAEE